MSTCELADDRVVVKSAFDFALDKGVLHFLLLLDNVFDLLNNAFERPLGQICRHLHVLLLALQFDLLHLLHEVSHLKHTCPTLREPIEHFLREFSIDFVFLEDSNFFDILRDLLKNARHKDRHLLLF